jgi:molybdopterin/thiamine biosynthesis adenylyltransferase
VEVIDESARLLDPLAFGWPLPDLKSFHVTLVGAGSIGSSAVESLASYGIRRFALVDPDRLHQHNFARHRVHPRELGRHKVNALADRMLDRDPDLKIERLPLDVIDDADVMRPLFGRSEIVLVCTDCVASRRVANHLARRANIPAVFACVLEDGAIGEVLRTRPWKTECLLCFRERLRERVLIICWSLVRVQPAPPNRATSVCGKTQLVSLVDTSLWNAQAKVRGGG